jgi:hypothetical protein
VAEMDKNSHEPRMELCPSCDRYFVSNDPPLADVILGEQECAYCGKRHPMSPNFRFLEINKFVDSFAALQKKVDDLEQIPNRKDAQT